MQSTLGDDRPVFLEDGRNVWPPHIYLHNIALALNNRLPDEHDRSREVAFLSYGASPLRPYLSTFSSSRIGASHVVVTLKTLLQKTYAVRITSAVFDEFQHRHPFWPKHKERSEVRLQTG
ncbi:hypothetical protein CALCODRAFT_502299, partial [Calocera cornea HHB12733]